MHHLKIFLHNQPKTERQDIGFQNRTKDIILHADITKRLVADHVGQLMELRVNYVVDKIGLIFPDNTKILVFHLAFPKWENSFFFDNQSLKSHIERWIMAQLPLLQVFSPEKVRNLG